jgi:hypothetical protein
MTLDSFKAGVRSALIALAGAAGLVALSAAPAAALPAYAVQTGQACSACHVGAFGPQLTPFGREFKLEGYTMRAGDTFTAPVSAMAVFSWVNTAKDQAAPPADHYGLNNNGGLDEASLFLAGGYGHFGGFTQLTFDGVGRSISWDNVDLRAIARTTLMGKDLLLGATLNNNPGIQDPWNTLGAWSFPYTDSDLMPGPDAAPVIDGGFEQTVLGTSVYAWWNESVYAEAGLYWMPGSGFMQAVGADASDAGGIMDGAAPYFRVAYNKDYGDQNWEVGAFGFFPSLYPDNDRSTGTSDHYSDFGVDASYQFTGDGSNTYTVNARYTHEDQDLQASYLLGNVAMRNNSLEEFRIDGSYYWHNMVGGTVGVFDTWGSNDPLLYADNRTFMPDSQGFILQADVTPWGRDSSQGDPRFNMRIGLQYIAYTSFNGSGSNYDGTGRSASDNNTLRIFTWLAL